MSPDDVCGKYADRNVKISITDLEDLVLIKGTKEGLEFLGELLLAQAKFRDSGFQMCPSGAGNALFTADSTRGLYIKRIDPASDQIARG